MSKFTKQVDQCGFSYIAHESNKYHGIGDQEAVDLLNDLYNELKELEYFLTQIDPVHFPDRAEARKRIAGIRGVLAKANGE